VELRFTRMSWLRENVEWSAEESRRLRAHVSRTIRDLARSEDGSRGATILSDATDLLVAVSVIPSWWRLDDANVSRIANLGYNIGRLTPWTWSSRESSMCCLLDSRYRVMRAMRFNWRRPYKDSTGSFCWLHSELLSIAFGIMILNKYTLCNNKNYI